MVSFGAWVQRLYQQTRSFTPIVVDRRRDDRTNICLNVTVRAGARSVRARTVNLSQGGLLIDKTLPVRAGAAVEVTVSGYGSTLSGRVTRIGANSAAITVDSRSAGHALMIWAASSLMSD